MTNYFQNVRNIAQKSCPSLVFLEAYHDIKQDIVIGQFNSHYYGHGDYVFIHACKWKCNIQFIVKK